MVLTSALSAGVQQDTSRYQLSKSNMSECNGFFPGLGAQTSVDSCGTLKSLPLKNVFFVLIHGVQNDLCVDFDTRQRFHIHLLQVSICKYVK